MSTLPRVLFSHDLPEIELRTACLDGEVYPLGSGYCSIDEIEQPLHRALAVLGLRSTRLIGELSTASWIWGARAALPVPLEFCAELGARARLAPSRQATVREVVLDPIDIVALGGVRVVTPLRAAVDLARFRAAFDTAEIAEVRALARIGGFGVDATLAVMDRRPHLHGKLRAAERLRLSLS